jgi:putative methylase
MRLRSLAIELSKLESVHEQKLELEQYQTEGELAARWISDILAFNDIFDGCRVADLGSGNGILGIGAVLAGAESSNLFEIDEESCSVCMNNVKSLGLEKRVKVSKSRIGIDAISSGDFDLVITNPPWGRQKLGADRPFFEAILSIGSNAHLMHSAEARHIEPLFDDAGWTVERYGEADFALPAAYEHHARERGRTRAAFWRLSPP